MESKFTGGLAGLIGISILQFLLMCDKEVIEV